ncbi:MAG: protein translocase subunit SecDF [Bacillaceae bacterium]
MVRKGRIIAFFLIVLIIGSTIGVFGKKTAEDISLGLDLQGGFEILYKVLPAKNGDEVTSSVVKSTVTALDKRVNALGVSEPNIMIEGEDRIRVQLAGVDNQNEARRILSTQAKLTFRDVNDNLLMDGSDLKQGGAKQTFDEQNRPSVGLTLKSAKQFAEVTKKVLDMAPNNQLVIWLDFEEGKDSYKAEAAKENPKFLSAASVSQVFNTNEVSITGGNFTVESAKELANLLNAGSLPVELKELYSTSVGAKFGASALDKTIFASIIGIAAVFLFMIFYYRLPGLVATIMLSLYLFLILLVFKWMGAVLTLPGIAAIVLGVGIAVDANIITYERIKDELKLGKSLMSAFRSGNQRSFATILDANLTTLLSAVVLYFFGISSVKGFATSLLISIAISFITAVFGSRLLLSLLVQSKAFNNKPWLFGVKPTQIMDISKSKRSFPPTRFDKIDFVKIGNKFLIFSGITIIVGAVILGVFRLNLGIDFTSGTRIEIQAHEKVSKATLEEEVKNISGVELDVKDITIMGDKKDIGVIRTRGVESKDEIDKIKTYFSEKYESEPSISTVSPTVGKELARNALIAILIASVGIVLYVSLRFQLSYALACIISLLHDAFAIVVFFSIFRIEVDLTFIAAILTIVGYSINDSIVTFDRVRENMRLRGRIRSEQDLKDIVNDSLRQTLGRSINTILTVLLTVIALYVFGSEAIRNFSLALLVGLVVGTYSSVFVASQLWLHWKIREFRKGKLKKEKNPNSNSDEILV